MDVNKEVKSKNVKITEDGVYFKDLKTGTEHFFSPEKSMQIQHDLGADIFFAFDECTSPLASREYQIAAMDRTHRWAKRCIDEHARLGKSSATGEQQALFAVVQGGANLDLRAESAKTLAAMPFDGFGIGGSFTKEDMGLTVKSSTENLPEDKPRHLLGIGEPIDLFLGVEYGIDTFDCVTPTRIARHGTIYSLDGKINLNNAKFRNDMSPVCDDPKCYAHKYTKSYLSHLVNSDEMLAATIASVHNLHFLVDLTAKIRQSILDDKFFEFKKEFCDRFYKN
jgi:queuine tRNA-ribosyltransferase